MYRQNHRRSRPHSFTCHVSPKNHNENNVPPPTKILSLLAKITEKPTKEIEPNAEEELKAYMQNSDLIMLGKLDSDNTLSRVEKRVMKHLIYKNVLLRIFPEDSPIIADPDFAQQKQFLESCVNDEIISKELGIHRDPAFTLRNNFAKLQSKLKNKKNRKENTFISDDTACDLKERLLQQ